MASSLSTCFLCTHTFKLKSLPTNKSPTLTTKPPCFTPPRLRFSPKAYKHDESASTTDSVETPPLQQSSPKPPQNSFSSLLHPLRYSLFSVMIFWVKFWLWFIGFYLGRNGWLKYDDLWMEILSIALPAAVALAADPIASLIDTAFVGHIGISLEMNYIIWVLI